MIVGIASINAGVSYFLPESSAINSIPPTVAFSNVTVDGTSLEADRFNDELTIIAGAGITLTPVAGTDTFTISSTGGGGDGSGSNVTATYVIFTNGTHAFASNGMTGVIDSISSDHDVPIQFALDAVDTNNGGLVFVKEGWYNINTKLRVGDNTHFRGSGWATTLFLLPGSDTIMIDNNNFGGSPNNANITISNLHLDGNRDNQAGNDRRGIAFRSINNTLVEHMFIENTRGHAVSIEDGFHARIHNNLCKNPKDDCFKLGGIVTQPLFSGSVNNNIATECGDTGVVLGYGFFQQANGNVITNSSGGAFGNDLIIISNYSSATNNVIGFMEDDGIQLDNAQHFILANNIIAFSGEDGIQVRTNSQNGTIMGNRIHDNGQVQQPSYGIRLGDAGNPTEGILIMNNVIYNSQPAATQDRGVNEPAGSNGNYVINNRVYGHTQIEIALLGDDSFARGNIGFPSDNAVWGDEVNVFQKLNLTNIINMGTDISTTDGKIRAANNIVMLGWRNVANDGDVTVSVNNQDAFVISGAPQIFFSNDAVGTQIEAKWERQDAAFTGVLGNFAFRANSDNPSLKDFAKMLVDVEDNTHGAEQSAIRFQVRDGTGGLPTVLSINDSCPPCGRIDMFMPLTVQAGDRISFRGTTDRTEGIQSDFNNQINVYTNDLQRLLIGNTAVRVQALVDFSISQGQDISLDGSAEQEKLRSDGTNILLTAEGIESYSFDSSRFDMKGNILQDPTYILNGSNVLVFPQGASQTLLGNQSSIHDLVNVTGTGCAVGQIMRVSGTSWNCANETEMKSGVVSALADGASTTVTFGTAFSSTPNVVATLGTNQAANDMVQVYSISTTAFTVEINQGHGGGGHTWDVQWIATSAGDP